MSEHVPVALGTLVRERARRTCEYCRLPQQGGDWTWFDFLLS